MSDDQEKTRPNRLSVPDQYALTRWIDDHKFELQGLSDEQLLNTVNQAVSDDIGKFVTSSNVKTALKTLGIELRQGTPDGALLAVSNEVTQLGGRFSKLEVLVNERFAEHDKNLERLFDTARARAKECADLDQRTSVIEGRMIGLHNRLDDVNEITGPDSPTGLSDAVKAAADKMIGLHNRLDDILGDVTNLRDQLNQVASEQRTVDDRLKNLNERLTGQLGRNAAIDEKLEAMEETIKVMYEKVEASGRQPRGQKPKA